MFRVFALEFQKKTLTNKEFMSKIELTNEEVWILERYFRIK